ncbi:MAG: T9SS type A sorting domain-containing protein [Moheibacter sp.]
MKNFIFFKILISFAFLFTISISPAQVITEQISRITDDIKYKRIFDQENYSKFLDENNRKIYVQNLPPPTQNATEGGNETQEVTLNINLIFDSEVYDAPWWVLIYNESGYMNYAFYEGTNLITIDVPPGTYDLYADFFNETKSNIVIKELVSITDNVTIDIDVAEASNYVSINTLDEDGNFLEPGVYNPETDTYSTTFFERSLYFNSYLPFSNVYMNTVNAPIEDSPGWNFYINNVSNRYSIAQSFFHSGNEEENRTNYILKFSTLHGITESVEIENNPEDWLFHMEKFKPSSLGESSGDTYPGFLTNTLYNGLDRGGWTIWFPEPFDIESGIKVYLNNPIDDDPADLLFFPAIVDHTGNIDPDWEEPFFMAGNPIVKDESSVTYGSGASIGSTFYFLGDIYYKTLDGYIHLPFHPQFSFSVSENPDIVHGNNVPVCVTETDLTLLNYIGRYGERRDSDFFATEVELKQDGETIFSGNYITDDFLNYVLPETGSLDLTFINTNINVDGLQGKNTTQLLFDRDQEDFTSPTVQHLQFRNEDDKVTDRFASGDEGFVRLAAGDFRYTIINEWGGGYYTYHEGNTVEFYYSLYDQNNWTELELTEYPEHFFMPAFGDYYEASLENVVVPEENSWFDVKIICTDAAGNKQEQIVSPAFKIEQANMGIEEINQSSFSVYPNPFTNEVNIKLPENVKGNYTFNVTDLSGRMVYTKNQSEKSFIWNGSNLPKGVYILSIESNGKLIAKKVIKK